jgi:hypothetical protein
VRERLLAWLLDLLERPAGSWDAGQVEFLHSLLEGQEGTKTLAELAVTSARIRRSGIRSEDLGQLQAIHAALEEFWNDPCAETYENLRAAGRTLEGNA